MSRWRVAACPGGGWGCGPEQLVDMVPWLVFTVDVSQWRGAHSFWPCFINILEHKTCSGGSPGAVYVNNLYTVYYQGQKLCAPPEDIINLK